MMILYRFERFQRCQRIHQDKPLTVPEISIMNIIVFFIGNIREVEELELYDAELEVNDEFLPPIFPLA